MKLNGKSILITAAGQGIGRAAALACARAGAQVFATDISESALRSLREEAASIQTAVLDVCDGVAVHGLLDSLPPLDGLFNCAGMVHEGTVQECGEAAWDRSFDLNVKSMHRTIQAALPGMLAKCDHGLSVSIVNMASMASSIKGFQRRYVYGATKAAVIGLTKAVAVDYVRRGLRCNAICPGTVETPSLRQRIAAAPDPQQAERDFIARQPMGRLAQVDDITPMIVYLLSDESRLVTGQAMLVDGGATL